MAEVRRSPQAEIDLEMILGDLDQNDHAYSQRYATAFDEKSKVIGQFPEIGRPRPEIAPNLRSTLVHPYVIFYRFEADVVQIIRILHGKRDLRSIMQAQLEE